MTDEIIISNPQSLKRVIQQINTDVTNNKLEVLFERGILEDGWLDTIDCCYYDYHPLYIIIRNPKQQQKC